MRNFIFVEQMRLWKYIIWIFFKWTMYIRIFYWMMETTFICINGCM